MWAESTCILPRAVLQFSTMISLELGENEGAVKVSLPDTDDTEPSGSLTDFAAVDDIELADEFAEFVKERTAEPGDWSIWQCDDVFWRSKGIPPSFELPTSLQKKVVNIEKLAEQRLVADREEILQEESSKQSAIVDRLIPVCTQWAQEHGLKTLRHSDLEVFLDEAETPLHYDWERKLYAAVNLALKSKKQ